MGEEAIALMLFSSRNYKSGWDNGSKAMRCSMLTGAMTSLFVLGAFAIQNKIAGASPSLSTQSTNTMPPSAPLATPSVATRSTHLSAAVQPTVRVSGNKLMDAQGEPVRLLGVDASGTEDACVFDRGFSYEPLTTSDAYGIASWGADAVRVPLNEDCWLGINGVSVRYSGEAYREAIERWVKDLNDAGIVAILDLHWSAPGTYEADRQWPMADADHSITFWSQVASAFVSNRSVVFDLFSEPFIGGSHPTRADWACWLDGCDTTYRLTTGESTSDVTYATAGMQELLDAVRKAGATQPVIVGGLNWAGDPCGVYDSGGNGRSCAWLSYEPNDPLHQLIVGFHTYNWTPCNAATCWNADIAPLTAVVPVITAEFGEDDCATSYISQYMTWADQHSISYLAWSWSPPNFGDTRCIVGNDINWALLSNSQTPNPSTIVPQGAVIRANLLARHRAASQHVDSDITPEGIFGVSTGPPASTPETSNVMLLPVAAMAALGIAMATVRRRRRRLLSESAGPGV